jgi:hypothetical protein
MRVAAHKGLYDITGDRPVLEGSRCASCHTTFFPALSLGCEVCGSTQLVPIALEATGVLHSVATVHLYQGHDIEAPFAVGEIQLDGGPLIRGTMAEVVERDAIGARVAASWATLRADDEGNDVVEPRFGLI